MGKNETTRTLLVESWLYLNRAVSGNLYYRFADGHTHAGAGQSSRGGTFRNLHGQRQTDFNGRTYIYALEGDGGLPPYRMRKAKPTDPDGYVNEYGRKNPRWQWFFDHGIGPVINPSPYFESIKSKGYFDDNNTLIMTNDYFLCPSFRHPDFDKRDIRNGSYGYNYQYLGNPRLTPDAGHFQNFPVYVAKLQRPSETVIIADSRGARGQTGPPDIPHGFHSYTLDPPRIARSRGATEFGFTDIGMVIEQQHSLAEARHSGKANVAFVDGHAEHLSLKNLGYVLDPGGNVIADHPEGNNCLWTGTERKEP